MDLERVFGPKPAFGTLIHGSFLDPTPEGGARISTSWIPWDMVGVGDVLRSRVLPMSWKTMRDGIRRRRTECEVGFCKPGPTTKCRERSERILWRSGRGKDRSVGRCGSILRTGSAGGGFDRCSPSCHAFHDLPSHAPSNFLSAILRRQ